MGLAERGIESIALPTATSSSVGSGRFACPCCLDVPRADLNEPPDPNRVASRCTASARHPGRHELATRTATGGAGPARSMRYPELIPDSPENIARALMSAATDWRYLEGDDDRLAK